MCSAYQVCCFSFYACMALSVLRVINCEVFVVSSAALPSPLWTQTPAVFESAPLAITYCAAQPVPQRRDGRRQK